MNFVDQDEVAHQQRRDHRAGRNLEGFDDEGAGTKTTRMTGKKLAPYSTQSGSLASFGAVLPRPGRRPSA